MMKNKQAILERIVSNPKVLMGKPVIHGLRISVEHILKMLGAGMTFEEIKDDYPFIEKEDIQACLLFAAEMLEGERIFLSGEA